MMPTQGAGPSWSTFAIPAARQLIRVTWMLLTPGTPFSRNGVRWEQCWLASAPVARTADTPIAKAMHNFMA